MRVTRGRPRRIYVILGIRSKDNTVTDILEAAVVATSMTPKRSQIITPSIRTILFNIAPPIPPGPNDTQKEEP